MNHIICMAQLFYQAPQIMLDKVIRKREPHHLYGTAFLLGPSNHAGQGQKKVISENKYNHL